jgi:hypothetical protein
MKVTVRPRRRSIAGLLLNEAEFMWAVSVVTGREIVLAPTDAVNTILVAQRFEMASVEGLAI